MCDTFARIGADGAVFAKNSDRPPDEPQTLSWHPPRPGGGELRTQYLTIADTGALGVLLSRPTWLWGAEHGVNDHGVAIGNEKVWAVRDHVGPPALIGMDLVRLGLERGRSADEATDAVIDLLETHGQGGACRADGSDAYDSSFLVVDRHGGWILETYGREWAAAPIGSGAAISNRYVLGRDHTRRSAGTGADDSTFDWHDPGVDTRIADHRLAATSRCARAGGALDPAEVAAVLRDHGTGPWGRPGRDGPAVPPPTEPGDDLSGTTVCMHGDWGANTAASMIVRLPVDGPPVAWACLGPPCASPYRRVDDLSAPPSELTDEASWYAAAARRDRLVTHPGELAAMRAAADPIERAAFGID